MKRICKNLALIMMVILLGSLWGCRTHSDMPYNGDITFHKMNISIPQNFIRDSTQSNEDAWLFESGFYSKLIILSRNDITGNTNASLDNYVEYMKQQNADSQREIFKEMDAVFSVYTKDDMFCQEMLFAYEGSFYAIALRGGTREEFQSLLDTVNISYAEDTYSIK